MAALLPLAACGGGSPAAQSGAGTGTAQLNSIFGVDYSPYTAAGEGPGTSVPEARVSQQLELMKGRVQWVKVHSDRPNIAQLAHQAGFKVAQFAFFTKESKFNTTEIGNLEANVRAGFVDMAIVGSESVWSHTLTADQLVAYINQVRSDLKGQVPVTTVEPDAAFVANPQIAAASDVVVVNLTPFSFKIALSQSLDWLKMHYATMQQIAHGKKIYIGETEWATDGGAYGAAVASPENAARYFATVEAWGRQTGVGIFYFEAFDEPWLASADANFGPHWGIWTSDGTLKPGFDRVFRSS